MNIPVKARQSSMPGQQQWIPLHTSLAFLLKNLPLLGWSLMLVALTGALTWIGYIQTIHLVDAWSGNFFLQPPDGQGLWIWIVDKGWVLLKYLYLAISRVAAFYLAFLAAYCLTCPGYVFLSLATEKKITGGKLTTDAGISFHGIMTDLIEGCKIGALGILVTVIALMVNFVPLVGQALVFFLYTFYSALMFLDYPASNRRWPLSRKISWINEHRSRSFRLGLLPALITLVPVINILFMALLFPLFTVHTTLNFILIEDH